MNNKRLSIRQIGISHEHALAEMRTLKAMPETFEIIGVADDRQLDVPKYVLQGFSIFEGLPFMGVVAKER